MRKKNVLLLTAFVGCWLEQIRLDGIRRQREVLSSALEKDLLLCYALEGSYPETLEELLEKYPLAYDRERFTVDYRFLGGNLLPDITILED